MKPIYLLKSALIGGIMLAASGANAQMVGADVFLQGSFLEVGVGSLGFYGSGGAAPTGYHPHTGVPTTNLGFVADPAMDGWSIGTPAYMGDYFVPGFPFEGWEFQVNGKRALAYNQGSSSVFQYDGGMPTCTGSNLSYSKVGSVVTGVWEGVLDSVILTQTTTFDTASLYFTINIKLTNTASTPKNDLYYFRTLDPDNDESWPGGSFTTDNLIEHQVHDTAVVSAQGLSSPLAYMALGTADTGSTAVIYNGWPIPATIDMYSVYTQSYFGSGAYYTQGIVHTADIAIGLLKYIPHLATVDSATDSVARTTATTTKHPANTASFSFFYAFSKAAVDSAITNTHKTYVAPPSTLGVNNVNTNTIAIYPNPSKELINISGLNATDVIELYDIMGRGITTNWNVSRTGTNSFSMRSISAGSYIVIVKDANGGVKARVPVRKL